VYDFVRFISGISELILFLKESAISIDSICFIVFTPLAVEDELVITLYKKVPERNKLLSWNSNSSFVIVA
jgi:hypothetical protein